MTDRLIATEGDLQEARDLETANDLDAMANTIRHLWDKLERMRVEASERERLYRNAFELGALEHRRVRQLQDTVEALETALRDRPDVEPFKPPAKPCAYFAVPGELPRPVKDFLLALAAPTGPEKPPTKIHVDSLGDFFATEVKIKPLGELGPNPHTKVEFLFTPERRRE